MKMLISFFHVPFVSKFFKCKRLKGGTMEPYSSTAGPSLHERISYLSFTFSNEVCKVVLISENGNEIENWLLKG